MRRKKRWSLRNINALLIAAVVVISVGVASFTGMMIANTDHLANYTSEIYKKPYAVNDAAWKMRFNIVFERNVLLSLLNDEGSEQSKREFLEQMYACREERSALKDILLNGYQGDKQTIEELYQYSGQIQQVHDQAIGLIERGQAGQAEDLLYGEVFPLYRKAAELAETIIDHSQQTMGDYVQESYLLNEQTNRTAIIWGGILVGLALLISILSVRTISRRNADIYHNNMLFSIISENVDAVFMVYDCVNQKLEYLSDNSQRILGLDPEEYKKNMEISRAYFDEENFRRASLLLEKDSSEILERGYQMIDPVTGFKKEMVSKRYPIFENGRVAKYVLMTNDLTEYKTAQRMLKSALKRAESANVAQREFLSRMSHEIRTPMNAIIGMTRVLEYSLQDRQKAEGCIKKINMASVHLLELINNVLDMSKIESGKLEIEKKEFSLNEMLGEIAALIQPKAEEKQQRFDVVLKNITQDMVVGDEMRIKQVLLNFLSNSVKFTAESGMIRITVRQLEQRSNQVYLKFKVKDNGIGMKEEFLPHVFDAFEQEEASTYRNFGGTGLGMALCKTLVESMGGNIEVQSVYGQGSSFSFYVWLGLPDVQQGHRLLESLKEMSVLIIDDDAEMREHLEVLCRQMGVCRAQAVESGIEAVRLYKAGAANFDVCLVDLYMPDVDGIHTAEWIRKEAGAGIYIVLMSAYDYKNVEHEALAAGVDDFILKPVMISDVSKILRRASGDADMQAQEHKIEPFDFTGKRILIAEDNELNLEIAEELCKHVGFKVETAENGKIAVEKFVRSPKGYYDAILMDVHMPVMGGYEAARLIRQSSHPDGGSVVIVAMTANAFYEDEMEALKSGMDLHMSKPIEPDVIFAALKKVLYDKE